MVQKWSDLKLSLTAAALLVISLLLFQPWSTFPVNAQTIVAVSSASDITGDGAAHALQATKTTARWVVVIAATTNTAAVRLGGSTVSVSQGAVVAAGGGFMYPPMPNLNTQYDLSTLYYYAAVGDKLTLVWGR